MTHADRGRIDALLARMNASPFYRLLGLRAESDAPGTSRVTLPFDEKLTQLYGGVHGGALMALADSAAGLALATTFTEGEANATAQLAIQFLEPAGPNDVVAEGRLLRRGARLAFCDVSIRAGGREVARAQGVCYVGKASRIDKKAGGPSGP